MLMSYQKKHEYDENFSNIMNMYVNIT